MMFDALLFAGVVLTGGLNQSFETVLAEIPQGQISERAAEADTPGSERWYSRIESFRVPQSWSVWTNGVPVTNAAAAGLEPALVRSNGCGRLDLAIRTPDGAASAFAAGQFSVRWDGGHAVATNHADFSCLDNYGFPLYWQRAHKLDADLYGAYFAAYNAYAERLKYGSMRQGQQSVASDAAFWLDPEHHFVRGGPSNDWHRLLERPVVTNFMAHVGRMRGNLKVVIPTRDKEPEFDAHPSFVDPGNGILDNWSAGCNDARLYWASTFKPPVVTQEVASQVRWAPDPDELGRLMPTFDWTDEAISRPVAAGAEEHVPVQFWQCYAITLDDLWNVRENPVRWVFDAVGAERTAGKVETIRGYDCGGLCAYMTNVFPFASRSSPNAAVSVAEYLANYGDTARSRKVLPGAFVGANHTLGVMNRLVYVPPARMCVTNDTVANTLVASYESDEEIEVPIRWDEAGGRWVYDGVAERRFTAAIGWNERYGYSLGVADVGPIHLRVGAETLAGAEDWGSSVTDFEVRIDLDMSDVDEMFATSAAEEYVELEGCIPSADSIDIDYHADADPGDTHYLCLVARRGDGHFILKPSLSVHIENVTIEPGGVGVDPDARHLPTDGTTDRVASNAVAYLDRRDVTSGAAVSNAEYRCTGEVAVSDYAESCRSHAVSLCDNVYDAASAMVWRQMGEEGWGLTPAPRSAVFKVGEGSEYLEGDDGECVVTLAMTHGCYVPGWLCILPHDSVRVHAVTNWVAEIERYNYVYYEDVLEIRRKTAEGWVFQDAVTNLTHGEYRITWEAITNGTSDVIVGRTTVSDEVSFPRFRSAEVMYEYDVEDTSRTTDLVTMTNAEYNVYVYDVTRVEIEAGTTNTTHATDRREERNWYYDEKYERRHADTSFERIRLTGDDVLALATNVVEADYLCQCPVTYRIHGDGTVRSFFHHPVDGHQIDLPETSVPLTIGTYGATIEPAEYNAYIPVDFRLFTEPLDIKARFSSIESADFTWKSMQVNERNTAP